MKFAELGKKVSTFAIFPVVSAGEWGPSITAGTNLNEVVQQVIDTLLIVVVIAAVIFIIFSGLKYIMSQGDSNKAKEAQGGITNALIGLIIAFAAYVVVTFIIGKLGVDPSDIQIPSA